MKNKGLAICCAGDQSLHERWSGRERTFDLFVIYFGDSKGKWQDSADYYMQGKGVKLHLIHDAVEAYPEIFSKYDTIFCPDDDIDTNTMTVNQIFRCFNAYPLALAQPALTRRSYIAHPMLRQKRFSFLRYTNFVEVMVPIMTKEVFDHLSTSFKLNKTAWGIDYLWASMVQKAGLGNIAIIDAYPVTHTRPVNVNGGYYKALNLDPWADLSRLLEEFDLSTEQRVYKHIYKFLGWHITV
jgi:hypothetical protein